MNPYDSPLKIFTEVVDKAAVSVFRLPAAALHAVTDRRVQKRPDFRDVSGTMTLAEFEKHLAMWDEECPSPALERWLNRLTHVRPLKDASRQVGWAWQRLTRGWDDRATWSLDSYISRTLADQLDHLAETTHGWPESEEFPTFEDWQRALRENATKLRQVHLRGFEYCTDDTPWVQGREALEWVAAHFGSLWD